MLTPEARRDLHAPVVGAYRSREPARAGPAAVPPAPREGPRAARMFRQLDAVWQEFESRLAGAPVLERLRTGTLSARDYCAMLAILGQQIIGGTRWIRRAAANLDASHRELRSLVLRYAAEEELARERLERDYVSAGGAPAELSNAEKGIGSEALASWMHHQAGQPNPLSLLGVLYVIEGLASRLGGAWGEAIRDQLGLRNDQVSFLLGRASDDARHLRPLVRALGVIRLDDEGATAIVRSALITARLYALQLEDLQA